MSEQTKEFQYQFLLELEKQGLEQLGLMSSAEPISIGLKCRFQELAQSSHRILFRRTLPEPTLKPQALSWSSPAPSLSRCARVQAGLVSR